MDLGRLGGGGGVKGFHIQYFGDSLTVPPPQLGDGGLLESSGLAAKSEEPGSVALLLHHCHHVARRQQGLEARREG